MIATGIDLGGTKIEVQLFGDDWSVAHRHRVSTPTEYEPLVRAIADQIRWADDLAGGAVPVGVGAAGLLNPATGLALTANLPASGKPFQRDIEAAIGRPITYVNDCRAMALSEAIFGVGQGQRTVVALILGTGIGGGIAVDGSILQGPTMTGGEFGHTAAPAHLVAKYDLPVVTCGCGRQGCVETYIAGPGMCRLAKALTGEDIDPPQIAARRTGDMAQVWSVWCEMTAELLHTITMTVDPNLIILGGGLSQIDGVVEDLTAAALRVQIGDFGSAKLVLAEGGDSSGARGAAYAAWQTQGAQHG
ncbi:ROK family protein [Aliiroseovarius sp. M344]|uniref:ROK family protein n=1 Tax=Aliiroseovarius sp. M344 TaxID=2867010 RepID=UPI0021ADDE23|nr:ROK family protein [Aliiroseovarius sp. M344]UWQ13203.1 ROK family protein [Aliiroseovarius sp. M344]